MVSFKMFSRAASSKGLTRAGESISKMIHASGFWLEASVPCHPDLSIGLLECPLNMAAGLPQSK